MQERAARLTDAWAARVRHNPALARAQSVLAPLAPAWWVLRGVVGAWAAAALLGRGAVGWGTGRLLLGALVGGSVWAGLRVRRGTRPVTTLLLGLADALAALLVAPFLLGVVERTIVAQAPAVVYESAPQQGGLVYNGSPVANVFVYDELGRPVPRARLVTEGNEEM